MIAFGHGEAFTLAPAKICETQADAPEPTPVGGGTDDDSDDGDHDVPDQFGWNDKDCEDRGQEQEQDDDDKEEDYSRDNTLVPIIMHSRDIVMLWGIPAEVRSDLVRLRTEFENHTAKQQPNRQSFKRGGVATVVDAMNSFLQGSGYGDFGVVRGNKYVKDDRTAYTAFLQYKAPNMGQIALAAFGISPKREHRAFVLHRAMSEVTLCLGALPDMHELHGHVFPILILSCGTRVDVSACISGHEAFHADEELPVLLRTQLGAMPLSQLGCALQFICEYSRRALIPLVRRHQAGEAQMHPEEIVMYKPNSCFRVGESFVKFVCHNNDPELRAAALERAKLEIAGWRIVHSTEISCRELDPGVFMLKMPSLVEPNQRYTGRGRHIEGEPLLAWQDLWKLEMRGLEHRGASSTHIVNGRIISFSHLKPSKRK